MYRYKRTARSEFPPEPDLLRRHGACGRDRFVVQGAQKVKPSPKVFSGWLEATRCPLISDLGDVVDSWQVGGSCPGAAMLCKLVREPACGRQCLTTQQQQTIIAAVAAICANPC